MTQEHAASTAALALYLACVRRLLKRSRGYECQEADGTFMLAFGEPADAVQFCLMVSLPMMMCLVSRIHSLIIH